MKRQMRMHLLVCSEVESIAAIIKWSLILLLEFSSIRDTLVIFHGPAATPWLGLFR